MLMDYHLQLGGRHGRDQGQELLASQVVGGRYAGAARRKKVSGCDPIGHIERVIADHGQVVIAKKLHGGPVAGEHAIGLLFGQ